MKVAPMNAEPKKYVIAKIVFLLYFSPILLGLEDCSHHYLLSTNATRLSYGCCEMDRDHRI